jgi:hypothetical protein
MGKSRKHDSAANVSDRGFGYLFAGVFVAIEAAIWWFDDRIAVWPVVVAAAFLAAALGRPGILMPLNRIWRRISHVLMRVNTAALTALAYAITVVPTGAVMRALGHDAMTRRIDKKAASYWTPVARPMTPERFEDQF